MAKRSKDSSVIENWLMYGIDLDHRRIDFGYLDGVSPYDDSGSNGSNDFWEANVNLAIRGILKMLDFSNAPIEIHMRSWGGSPHDMLALYDMIQESSCKFIFYGRGKLMSAATWIMCGCDERYVSKHTRIMLHDGNDEFMGKQTDFQIYADEGARYQTMLNEIYAENSFYPKKFWDNFVRRDLYITPEEAVKMGLIENIIPYKKRGNFRRTRARTFANVPTKTAVKRLINKLGRRIKLPDNIVVDVRIPKDQFEKIDNYNNTEKEENLLKEAANEIEHKKDSE